MRNLIKRPFKGTVAYEWQVGPFVFQIRRRGCDFPLVNAWRDPFWRSM